MSQYRCLLFDADGTLFDYDQAEAAALANTFPPFMKFFSEKLIITGLLIFIVIVVSPFLLNMGKAMLFN